MTILQILLLLAQASRALQDAHDALVTLRLHDIAARVHVAGETVALVVGMVVRSEAEKRRAELDGVSS